MLMLMLIMLVHGMFNSIVTKTLPIPVMLGVCSGLCMQSKQYSQRCLKTAKHRGVCRELSIKIGAFADMYAVP